MKELSVDIIKFFQNQGFVIVSTVDKRGNPHSSCKGVVQMGREGRIYIFDLYRGRTYENLRQNPHISITAVDEHRFKGYCLKGRGKAIEIDKLSPEIIKAWEDKITNRVTRRVLKNIHGEKGHPKHPEILLPKPEYMIVMKVEEIVNLTPQHIKEGV